MYVSALKLYNSKNVSKFFTFVISIMWCKAGPIFLAQNVWPHGSCLIIIHYKLILMIECYNGGPVN